MNTLDHCLIKLKALSLRKAVKQMLYMYKIKVKNQTLIIRVAFFLLLLAVLAGSGCKSSKKSSDRKSTNPQSSKKDKKKDKKSAQATSDKAAKVIKTARSFIGTSYKYGGTNRAGLDCSGLMLLSFKSVEVQLPRNSEEQSKVGSPVSVNELQPGDLLFFSDKKGHKKISHVGLVTEVHDQDNIKFIHSTTKLGVVENNLKSAVYYPIFLKAIRVL